MGLNASLSGYYYDFTKIEEKNNKELNLQEAESLCWDLFPCSLCRILVHFILYFVWVVEKCEIIEVLQIHSTRLEE